MMNFQIEIQNNNCYLQSITCKKKNKYKIDKNNTNK